jgi:hypothetical protein
MPTEKDRYQERQGAMCDSQECRNRAQECIRVSESSSNPLDRNTFFQLATAWLWLANHIDTDQALIEHWGALDRPTDSTTVSIEPDEIDLLNRPGGFIHDQQSPWAENDQHGLG